MVVFTSAWPEELLDRLDVVAFFKKLRSERVRQGVTARVLVDAHLPYRRRSIPIRPSRSETALMTTFSSLW